MKKVELLPTRDFWAGYGPDSTPGGGGGVGLLTYLAQRGCAALMGRFFTRNP